MPSVSGSDAQFGRKLGHLDDGPFHDTGRSLVRDDDVGSRVGCDDFSCRFAGRKIRMAWQPVGQWLPPL